MFFLILIIIISTPFVLFFLNNFVWRRTITNSNPSLSYNISNTGKTVAIGKVTKLIENPIDLSDNVAKLALGGASQNATA